MDRQAWAAVRAEALRLMLEEGLSGGQVGRRLGIRAATPCEWARQAGLVLRVGRRGGLRVVPSEGFVSASGRLTLQGRTLIQIRHQDGWSNARIATELGVHRSTVGRELGRHTGPQDRYLAHRADQLARHCAHRHHARKLDEPRLRAVVVDKLNHKWSPQQIAGWLKTSWPDDHTMQVSHETIYQALYVQARGGLRHELSVEQALRSHRTGRKPVSKLPTRTTNRSWIGPEAHISQRPPEAADRAVPGHWEGDLVIGARGKSALITLVERATRYVLIGRLPERHDTDTVTDRLITLIGHLPAQLRRSLTWDQGPEMAAHTRFTTATLTQVYFCDPHSPWMRGSNENTNGLIRDYYPKGTDFAKISDQDITTMQDQLNTRPRQTLDWATPAEKMAALLGVAPES